MTRPRGGVSLKKGDTAKPVTPTAPVISQVLALCALVLGFKAPGCSFDKCQALG